MTLVPKMVKKKKGKARRKKRIDISSRSLTDKIIYKNEIAVSLLSRSSDYSSILQIKVNY